MSDSEEKHAQETADREGVPIEYIWARISARRRAEAEAKARAEAAVIDLTDEEYLAAAHVEEARPYTPGAVAAPDATCKHDQDLSTASWSAACTDCKDMFLGTIDALIVAPVDNSKSENGQDPISEIHRRQWDPDTAYFCAVCSISGVGSPMNWHYTGSPGMAKHIRSMLREPRGGRLPHGGKLHHSMLCIYFDNYVAYRVGYAATAPAILDFALLTKQTRRRNENGAVHAPRDAYVLYPTGRLVNVRAPQYDLYLMRFYFWGDYPSMAGTGSTDMSAIVICPFDAYCELGKSPLGPNPILQPNRFEGFLSNTDIDTLDAGYVSKNWMAAMPFVDVFKPTTVRFAIDGHLNSNYNRTLPGGAIEYYHRVIEWRITRLEMHIKMPADAQYFGVPQHVLTLASRCASLRSVKIDAVHVRPSVGDSFDMAYAEDSLVDAMVNTRTQLESVDLGGNVHTHVWPRVGCNLRHYARRCTCTVNCGCMQMDSTHWGFNAWRDFQKFLSDDTCKLECIEAGWNNFHSTPVDIGCFLANLSHNKSLYYCGVDIYVDARQIDIPYPLHLHPRLCNVKMATIARPRWLTNLHKQNWRPRYVDRFKTAIMALMTSVERTKHPLRNGLHAPDVAGAILKFAELEDPRTICEFGVDGPPDCGFPMLYPITGYAPAVSKIYKSSWFHRLVNDLPAGAPVAAAIAAAYGSRSDTKRDVTPTPRRHFRASGDGGGGHGSASIGAGGPDPYMRIGEHRQLQLGDAGVDVPVSRIGDAGTDAPVRQTSGRKLPVCLVRKRKL